MPSTSLPIPLKVAARVRIPFGVLDRIPCSGGGFFGSWVPLMLTCGVGHVVIESQGAREDGRDRASLLDTFRRSGGVPFTYDWHTKAEPLLWVADAVGGACRGHLIGRNSEPFERLQAMGAIDAIAYV